MSAPLRGRACLLLLLGCCGLLRAEARPTAGQNNAAAGQNNRAASPEAKAASPENRAASPENLVMRLWQTRDGLTEQTVQAIAQTSDGYLWIGTSGGLLRFDGSHFVLFSRDNTPAFQENSVFSLFVSRDGTLWIGTDGGGLLRLQRGVFRQFSVADGLTDSFVRTVLEDRRGVLWVGTDNGLFQLASSTSTKLRRVDGTPEVAQIAVHGMTESRDGTVWVGGSRLVAFSPAPRDVPLVGQYSETRVKCVLQTGDGALWVGTVSGLQRMASPSSLRGGAARFVSVRGIQSTVRTLRQTADGTLWIGTIGQGAFTWRNDRLAVVAPARPLPSRTILNLFEDAERNLWIGTQTGLLRFSRSPMDLVPLPKASDSDFETIAKDRDNSLWVASTRLYHLVDGIAKPVTFPELHGARVRNVFRDAAGALWIGTDGRGLFRLAPHEAPRQFTTANGLVNNFVRGMLQARNGDLWIATDEGVSRFAGGSFQSFQVQDGLAYFSVRTLLEDRGGDLWIGTDHGLSHLHEGRFVQDAATAALRNQKVWAALQSSGGALWFGTRANGLFRAEGSSITHYTVDQGLASNSVYSLLEDRTGRFWIGGAGGIATLAEKDLEGQNELAHGYLSQQFFSVSDGSGLADLYGGTQPSAAITSAGEAWFPTAKGPVRFSAQNPGFRAIPRVFIDQITADGRVLPSGQPIALTANNAALAISYGSILLGPLDAVQFQYRLEGFDSEWHYGTMRRIVDYPNLPAGRYTFRVRAFGGGSGQMTESSFRFSKREYFYRTAWFLTLCIVLLALLIWLFHYQRLRRVHTAFQAVLDERARLAREMHDTLIQGCAGVSLLLEACASAEGDEPEVRLELIDYARTQLAASIDEARQAVWNLRGAGSADFAKALKSLAERTERGSNIPVECTIEGQAYDFDTSAMHEITMVSREAVYNALLHANPSGIQMRANFGKLEFSLTVKDDGSGFETIEHAPQGHYGLLGIQERVKRLGGTVRVNSALARGTEIVIRVPRQSVDRFARQEEVHP